MNGPADSIQDCRTVVGALLGELRDGRREALDELFPIVYRELRELAHRGRRAWTGHNTLTTTALVHELYLKLVDQHNVAWGTEAHFLAAAAKAVRHILINYARDRRAQKRGGGFARIPLSQAELSAVTGGARESWEERVIALEAALARLADLSEEQSRVVECRFFGGMTVEQTAEALGFSTATVVRRWAMARAWLHRELAAEFSLGAPA